VNWYDEDQIPELYSHCENADETLLVDFLFQTMTRADELAYIEYSEAHYPSRADSKSTWTCFRSFRRRRPVCRRQRRDSSNSSGTNSMFRGHTVTEGVVSTMR
jgi:hypothetical protein